MNRAQNLAQQQIGRCVARVGAEVEEKSVLEGVGEHVHLVRPESNSHPDVVITANHVERIGNRENVRSALEGRKSSIPQ